MLKRPSAWETIDHTDLIDDFPILTEEEIGDVTLGKQYSIATFLPISMSLVGVFQLKRAPSYAAEKVGTTDLTAAVTYSIQRCRPFPDVIRVATRSAHSNCKTYHPTIQFSADEILGWWCDCPIGSRIIGCCSHVSSVIWFLSYRRWESNNTRRKSTDPLNFIRDSIPISDFYDSSDDEDNNTNRYSLA